MSKIKSMMKGQKDQGKLDDRQKMSKQVELVPFLIR